MTSRSEALSLASDFWPWSRSLFTAHGSRQGIFAVSGRHSERFISKQSGAAVRLACASTCDEWGESIQHFIQLAPVVGHALHQVWELMHRDSATPARKLHLSLKNIGWSKVLGGLVFVVRGSALQPQMCPLSLFTYSWEIFLCMSLNKRPWL